MTNLERMSDYIKLAFRVAFPKTPWGGITVAFLELTETWVVAVVTGPAKRMAIDIYSMTVGSDDDEFSFRCTTDESKPRVKFALMPEGE